MSCQFPLQGNVLLQGTLILKKKYENLQPVMKQSIRRGISHTDHILHLKMSKKIQQFQFEVQKESFPQQDIVRKDKHELY